MTIDDKFRVKRLQYDSNREAAKISALSSGKIDKYEYLKDEENLPSKVYIFSIRKSFWITNNWRAKKNTNRRHCKSKTNFFFKKSGEIKLKEKKNLQNLFKSNLNEIPRGRHRSEEQKSALENNKLVYESRDVFIKLSNDYSSIAFEPKYETVNRKGIPSMSAHVAQGRVPKVSKHSKFKISNLKKCFKNYQ